jgi:hypothetical protein
MTLRHLVTSITKDYGGYTRRMKKLKTEAPLPPPLPPKYGGLCTRLHGVVIHKVASHTTELCFRRRFILFFSRIFCMPRFFDVIKVEILYLINAADCTSMFTLWPWGLILGMDKFACSLFRKRKPLWAVRLSKQTVVFIKYKQHRAPTLFPKFQL